MHAYHMHACFCLFPNKLSSWVICNDVQKLTSLKSSKQTGPKLFLTLDSAFCTYICSLITRIFLLIICKRYVGLLAPFFTKNICKDIYIYICTFKMISCNNLPLSFFSNFNLGDR